MKNFKRILSGMFCVSVLVTNLSGVTLASSDDNHLISKPPVVQEEGVNTRGANAPTSSAGIHNLSTANYNYTVNKMGAQLYTDKWITGSTKANISVNNWAVNEHGGTSNRLTVSVHNSSGVIIDTKTINPNTTPTVSLTGLSSSSKYYVKFAVPYNGNTYSFNGSISK